MKTTRFEVRYKLKVPLVILNKLSCFDSILAKAIVDNSDDCVDFFTLNDCIPIKKLKYKDKYIHSASIAMYDHEMSCKCSHVQFNEKIRYLPFLSNKSVDAISHIAGQSSGPWKSKVFTFAPILTRYVSYVVDVINDGIDSFMELSLGIKYIGKKRSLGYGMVEDIEIKETNNPVIRPVPLDFDNSMDYREPFVSTTILPPYWKGERVICGMVKL